MFSKNNFFLLIVILILSSCSDNSKTYCSGKNQGTNILEVKEIDTSKSKSLQHIEMKIGIENHSKIKLIGTTIKKENKFAQIFLTTVDSNHEVKQIKIKDTFKEVTDLFVTSMTINSHNEILMGGWLRYGKNSQYGWMIKVNFLGEVLFSKAFLRTVMGVDTNKHGDIVTISAGKEGGILLKKFNIQGHEIWTRLFNENEECFPEKVKITSNGTIFVARSVSSNSLSSHISIMTLSEKGFLKRDNSLHKDNFSALDHLEMKVKSNNLYLLMSSNPIFSKGKSRVFRLNDTGKVIWDYLFLHHKSSDELYSLILTKNDNILIFGKKYYDVENEEDLQESALVTLKLDTNSGKVIEKKEFCNVSFSKNFSVEDSYLNNVNEVILFHLYNRITVINLDKL